MSTLQALRNKSKLKDAAKTVLEAFGYGTFVPFIDSYVNRLSLMQSEELIRELKAILSD